MATRITLVDLAAEATPEPTVSALWMRHYGFQAWFWHGIRPALTDTPGALQRQGWCRLEPDQMPLFDCLLGQLADVRQREGAGDGHPEYWVPIDDLAHAATYQSALGFLPPDKIKELLPSHLAAPPSVNPFPPPNLGVIGVVQHDLNQEYPIAELDSKTQALQLRLEEALRLLQADPGGSVSLFRLMASLPTVYSRYYERLLKEYETIHISWSERLADFLAGHRTPDPARARREQQIASEIRGLEAAQRQIASLGHPLTDWDRLQQKALYEQLWPEIRQIARKLAIAYYRHAHPAIQPETLATPVVSLPPLAVYPLTPEAWLASKQHHALVLADPVSRALSNILRAGDAFTGEPGQGFLSHTRSLQAPVGTALLEIRLVPNQERGESWADVLRWQAQMNDHLVDTWLAIQMLALACTPEDLATPQAMTAQLLLETCLREKTHYGYPYQQRQHMLQDVEALKHLQMRIRLSLPYSGMPSPPIESPLLVVQDEAGERFQLTLGDWINLLPSQWRATATISRKILQLHPKNERYAKRLGLILCFLFIDHPQRVTLDGATLLALTGLSPDVMNPKRTRDSWMRAFKVLTGLPTLTKAQREKDYDEPVIWDSRAEEQDIDPERQIIGGFWAERIEPEVQQAQRGYLERWLKLPWSFQPIEW